MHELKNNTLYLICATFSFQGYIIFPPSVPDPFPLLEIIKELEAKLLAKDQENEMLKKENAQLKKVKQNSHSSSNSKVICSMFIKIYTIGKLFTDFVSPYFLCVDVDDTLRIDFKNGPSCI